MTRRLYTTVFVSLVTAFCYAQALAVSPDDLVEHRYAAKVERNANGTIHRSSAVISAFRKVHPCPSSGQVTGACPGWQINHVIPLACGGRDAVDNMGWFPTDIKACAGAHCIDRWERKVYALTPPVPDTANCVNEVVK